MKHIVLILLMAAGAAAASAQNATGQAAPAATANKPTVAANPPAKLADIHCNIFRDCVLRLPPGIPPAKGKLKSAFSLYYQDIKIGTGALAEPYKTYIIQYTGWLAADGHKFDSTYDHRGTIMGKDGKPVKDADGKDQLGPSQPFSFTQGTQGYERVLTGLDQGFEGMRVGGKRRIIIPYQLAYGAEDRPAPEAGHQGIPPKSDLIFDVELLDVADPPRRKE
jgi:peptidylprolyl isomerase